MLAGKYAGYIHEQSQGLGHRLYDAQKSHPKRGASGDGGQRATTTLDCQNSQARSHSDELSQTLGTVLYHLNNPHYDCQDHVSVAAASETASLFQADERSLNEDKRSSKRTRK